MIEHGSFLQELDEAVLRGSAECRLRALWHTTDLLIAGTYSEDQIWTFGEVIGKLASEIEVAARADGINSPFASAFVKNLPTPGLEVRRLFDFVRDDVMEATGRKQKPFSYGSISGRQDFYFVAGK
jgi:hypothetical protein